MAPTASRRHEGAAHLVDIAIERSADVSLGRQLYLALRGAIVAGRMPAGERLPSTRAAARLWGVSRGTVVEAYETLLGEGYTIGRTGSGTYVAGDVPERSSRRKHVKPADHAPRRPLSAAAGALVGTVLLDPPPQVAFVTGRAAPDDKTRSILKRLGHRHLNTLSDHYRDPQGEKRLRDAVATYLAAARGVRCEPGRILSPPARNKPSTSPSAP